MDEISEALSRADQEAFTRRPPRTLRGQIGYLIRQLGSARAVAAEIGVTADSVNRYRRGARRNPPPAVTARVEAAVRAAGAGDEQLRRIVAEGLRDVYFRDGGTRALGLTDVALTDIDYIDLEF